MSRALVVALGAFFLTMSCDGKDICQELPDLCDSDGTTISPDQIIDALEDVFDSIKDLLQCDTLDDDSAQWLKDICSLEQPQPLMMNTTKLILKARETTNMRAAFSLEEHQAGLDCVKQVTALMEEFNGCSAPGTEKLDNIIKESQACLTAWEETAD
jgi:hypothetical protein